MPIFTPVINENKWTVLMAQNLWRNLKRIQNDRNYRSGNVTGRNDKRLPEMQDVDLVSIPLQGDLISGAEFPRDESIKGKREEETRA
jgi:hypothetical protein